MEQIRHYQNFCWRNRGINSQRKAIRCFHTALVGVSLAAFSLAAAISAYGQTKSSHHAKNEVAGSVTAGFNQKTAWDYLVKQCDFGPRVPGTEAHEKCLKFLQTELSKYCDNVFLQPLTHHWSYTGQTLSLNNVIGTQNWEHAKIRVVLLAHWDSRPFADQDPDPANHTKPILGADDGASGVAVLLELAKALQHKKLPIGVMYLLDDGEDLGPQINEMLLGVDYYAQHLASPKPNYGILLDMIGNKGVKVPIEPNSYDANEDFVRTFYRFAKKVGLSKTFPDTFGEAIEDDHLPLINAGIPTIDLIDFNYPYWHTVKDTPDKCSAESLGEIGTMLYKWILQDPPYQITANK